MFYLLGRNEVVKCIASLSSTITYPIKNYEELYSAYRLFIKSIWPPTIPVRNFDQQFLFDSKIIANIIEPFIGKDEITDIATSIQNTSVESMLEASISIDKGKIALSAKNSEILDLFNLVIHTLFYTKSVDSGGGSASNLIGTIWCSNKKNWTPDDVAEFLVHELSHNLVFLDERRHKHYRDFDLIAKNENFVISAVLKKKRPLDKAFHSLVVAHEIIQFRLQTGEPDSYNVHPRTFALIENCKNTVTDINGLLKEKSYLVHDRVYHLMEMLTESIARFEERIMVQPAVL